MSVGIDLVHQLCYNIAAKQFASFPSPNDFNSYANFANIDLFNYYNDERERMLVSVKQGESLYIPPVLSDFVRFQVPLTQVDNMLTLPDDYIYDLELTTTVNGVTILYKKIDYNKVANYLNSTIDPPTTTTPVYVELPNALVMYPPQGSNLLTYLKIPDDVAWGYSLVNDRPVYNPSLSIDFEWNQSEFLRLVSRILTYMGISIRDTELEQASKQMEVQAS